MNSTLIFYSLFKKYWFQDPLQSAHWKTPTWPTQSATHHSGHLLSFLLSYLTTSLNFSQRPGPLLYSERAPELWFLSLSPSCKFLHWYHPFICPLSLPSWKRFLFSTRALDRYRSLNSGLTYDAGPGWLAVVPGVYFKCPWTLKQHAQPHKSPAAYVSWYHKLLVISTNKIERMSQKEVSLWQPLVPPDMGGGVMEHDKLLLGFTSCCKDVNWN